MAINKDLKATTPVSLVLTNSRNGGTAQVWRLAATNQIVHLTDVAVTSTRLAVDLPPQSLTLFVIPPAAPPRLSLPAPGADGRLILTVVSPAGRPCVVETSPDLRGWSPLTTNTPVAGSFTLTLPPAPSTATFYRANASYP